MKKINQIMALALSIIFMFSTVPVAAIDLESNDYDNSVIESVKKPLSDSPRAASAEEQCGTYDGVDWKITDKGQLLIGAEGEIQEFDFQAERLHDSYPWYEYRKQIMSVAFLGTVSGTGSMAYMFNNQTNNTSIIMDGFETSNVTDMSGMFAGCSSITSLNLCGFDTHNVTNMRALFSGCFELTFIDLSSFNTSNVTDMSLLFSDDIGLCFEKLDFSGFDTRKVTTMQGMFSDCKLNNFNFNWMETNSVTTMRQMFMNCTAENLDLRSFDTRNVKDMSGMFICQSHIESSIEEIDLSSFDTSKVETMSSMFSGLKNLKSIDVTNFDTGNVEDMRSMFREVNQITSIDLSNFDTKKVKDMSYMFLGCSRLKTLDLNSFDTSEVENLSYMLYGCESLESIELKSFDMSSVKTAEECFQGCISIKSLSTPYNLSISISLPVVLYDSGGNEYTTLPQDLGYSLTLFNDNAANADGDISFNYIRTEDDGKGTTSVYYSDRFFLKRNDVYDHELATASLGMAMAGMKRGYVKSFLANCGFINNIEQSVRYNEEYKKNDDDKVAYTFATKEINGDTVIAISLRGGDYGNEWGSNGRVGSLGRVYGYHFGFNAAADNVVKELVSYCNSTEHTIDLNKAKIWLTGYSRSAAVANCLGEKLEKQGLIDIANLYCYTFATPRTVTESNVDRSVQGIYSIVNPIDLVPCVPMNSSSLLSAATYIKYSLMQFPWAYTRHGKSLELPSKLGTKDFNRKQNMMASEFYKLTGKSYKRFSGVGLQALLDILVAVSKSEEYFVTNLQDQIIVPALEDFVSAQGAVDDTRILQLISNIPGARQLLILKGFLSPSTKNNAPPRPMALKSGPIGMQHWPETYMAWMKTGYEPKKPTAIKSIFVQCPVDVEVYDSDNELIARITDDNVDESIDGLEAYVDEAGAKAVFMPADADYSIRLIATDDGEMTYSIREFSGDRILQRKVEFDDIRIEKEQVFTGTVNAEIDTATDNYALESEGQTIEADHDYTGDELNNVEILAEVDGDGAVMGEGMYTAGDSVVLTATSYENSKFVGWFDANGEKLTSDTFLTTTADADTVYKAVFKRIPVVGKTYNYKGYRFKVLTYKDSGKSGTVALTKAKNSRIVSVPSTAKIEGVSLKVTQVNAKAFTGSKIRTVTLNKNVKTIKKYAFAKSRATKIVVKTKLLKKSAVKGSLRSSKIKTIKVSLGKKSVNKTYVKKYKKIFTKANAGKKVTVK